MLLLSFCLVNSTKLFPDTGPSEKVTDATASKIEPRFFGEYELNP